MTKRQNNPKYFLKVAVTLIILAILTFIVVSFFVDEDIVIRSDDGKATLTITAGSLSKGVDTQNLSIKAVTVPYEFQDDIIAIYQLSPSGVTFTKKAEFTLELDMNESELWEEKDRSFNLPLLIQSDDDGTIKELENLETIANLNKGKLSLNTKIDSFSFISISNSSPLLVSLVTASLEDNFKVGENFEIEVNFSSNTDINERVSYRIYSREGLIVYENFVESDGIIITKGELRNPDYLTPDIVTEFPKKENLVPGTNETISLSSALTCSSESPETREEIQYRVSIDGTLKPVKKTVYYHDGRVDEIEMTELDFARGFPPMEILVEMDLTCVLDKVEVTMLIRDGQQFPAVQFDTSDPDLCQAEHYHPIANDIFYNKDRQAVTDPDPSRCGLGTVAATRIEKVEMLREEAKELSDFLVSQGKPPIPLQ